MPGPGEKIIEKGGFSAQASGKALSEPPGPIAASQIYTVTCEAAIRDVYQDPLIGQTLEGKYLVESVLGWGGMSVVYKARQLLIDRTVAIKTIKFRADERPDLWQRFQREIKTLSRLSHPNIVSVYDCLLSGSAQPFVVMDFIKGVGLDVLLADKIRLPLAEVRIIGCQVASGVEHAHRHDVIHRDIKCANIMIVPGATADANCAIKVVDFGLAKFGDDDQKLTQTGQLWGSPPYISPEQIKGLPVDRRSDIYSLAVVVYEMATGIDPFHSEVVYEMLHGHLHQAPPLFAEVCPDLDAPALEAVLQKGMAKEPEERFQTMSEFRLALQKACMADEAGASGDKLEAALAPTVRVKTVSGQSGQVSKSKSGPAAYAQTTRAGLAPANSSASHSWLAAILIILVGTLVLSLAEGARHKFVLFQGQGQSQEQSRKQSQEQSPGGVSTSLAGIGSAAGAVRSVHGPSGLSGLSVSHPSSLASFHAHHQKIKIPYSVKKVLPKASQPHVDQSKFEVLRDLRSSSLRKDVGD